MDSIGELAMDSIGDLAMDLLIKELVSMAVTQDIMEVTEASEEELAMEAIDLPMVVVDTVDMVAIEGVLDNMEATVMDDESFVFCVINKLNFKFHLFRFF